MRRAWRWWGVWVCVGVVFAGIGCGALSQSLDLRSRDTRNSGKLDGSWKDGNSNARTRKDLDEVLLEHDRWVLSFKNQGRQADLSRADLSEALLRQVDLIRADLTDAYLEGAHLTEAKLGSADLNKAFLVGSDLDGADLSGADLTDANVDYAAMRKTKLIETDLSDATFRGADLTGAIYEPKIQPLVQTVAYAIGLDRLRYDSNPAPLVTLRKAFEGAGFEQQRREITAAIHRSRLKNERSRLEKACDDPDSGLNPFSCLVLSAPRTLSWLAFDWTCAWGADWSHPLVLLGWLCMVCGPVYWVGMHFGRVGGIYQIVLDTTVVTKASKELVTRVETGVRWGGRPALRTRTFGQRERRVQTQIPYGNDKKERQGPKQGQTQISCEKDEQRAEEDLRSPRKRVRRPGSGWGRVGPVLRAEWRALRLAFLFSVLSALDIGFHEFNVGVWARMLLARDFNLKARGWMRVAGGMQSLVGLGLVALSLLSYFGHPFD